MKRSMMGMVSVVTGLTILLVVANASASPLSWSTAPVLGITATLQENGDVLVETDSGSVGVPAYNNSPYGDGVSMNVFVADSMTGLAAVAHGSSANVDVSSGYIIASLWYLNDELQLDGGYEALPNDDPLAPDYDLLWGNETLAVGNWRYTETWTNAADSLDTITFSTNFTVVPEPGTLVLLGMAALGLLGCVGRRRRS